MFNRTEFKKNLKHENIESGSFNFPFSGSFKAGNCLNFLIRFSVGLDK